MDAVQYKQQLQALLPPGRAFPRIPDSLQDNLLLALADELARVDGRAGNLLSETPADTTDELLPDWERVAGLPDACTTGTPTKQERRNALVARLADVGEATPAAFVQAAADLGFTVTVTEFLPFETGAATAGAPISNGDWVFVLQINGPAVTVLEFGTGVSAVGEQLRSWGNELLECGLSHLIQAHWILIFTYAEA